MPAANASTKRSTWTKGRNYSFRLALLSAHGSRRAPLPSPPSALPQALPGAAPSEAPARGVPGNHGVARDERGRTDQFVMGRDGIRVPSSLALHTPRDGVATASLGPP